MIEIIKTTTKTEVEAKPFPKLMKGKITGGIAFFTEPKKGLWLARGQWYDCWAMELFDDYNEPVTIKNK